MQRIVISLFVFVFIGCNQSAKQINTDQSESVSDTLSLAYGIKCPKSSTLDLTVFDSISLYVCCSEECDTCKEYKVNRDIKLGSRNSHHFFYRKYLLEKETWNALDSLLKVESSGSKGPESTCCLKYFFQGYIHSSPVVIATIDDCYMSSNGYLTNKGINQLKQLVFKKQGSFTEYWGREYYE